MGILEQPEGLRFNPLGDLSIIDSEASIAFERRSLPEVTAVEIPEIPSGLRSIYLSGRDLPSGPIASDVENVDPRIRVEKSSSSSTEGELSQYLGKIISPWMAAASERRHIDAAVMVVDIVDSTSFLEEIERRGMFASAVLEQIFSPLAEAVRVAGGECTAVIGDALSAIFTRAPAAWNALNAAMSIQEQRSQDLQAGLLRPCMRIGLSYGKVEFHSLANDVQPRAIGSVVNRAFHCASGKCEAERLPDTDSGFTVLIDKPFREQVDLPYLVTVRP